MCWIYFKRNIALGQLSHCELLRLARRPDYRRRCHFPRYRSPAKPNGQHIEAQQGGFSLYRDQNAIEQLIHESAVRSLSNEALGKLGERSRS